jgi:predicted solute-binding protein
MPTTCRTSARWLPPSVRRTEHDLQPGTVEQFTLRALDFQDSCYCLETDGIVIEQVLSDIETLNRAAFKGLYEVTAVSFHAYAHLMDHSGLLPHGASMGDRYGPIVVGTSGGRDRVKDEPDFSYVVVPFDEIQQAVLNGRAEAGLLSHEGQIRYQEEGFKGSKVQSRCSVRL